MIDLLPSLKNDFYIIFSWLQQKVKGLFASKKACYKVAAILDLVLIGLILVNGRQPVQQMMTPLVSSVETYYSVSKHQSTRENFAFVPGLARNKFSRIDLRGLTYLSFFDVPLTQEGEIDRNSKGYVSFTSGETRELFESARYQKAKILLTLSAGSADAVRKVLENGSPVLLAEQAAEEVSTENLDGVTLDFEFSIALGKEYQEKFTNFVQAFTGRVHELSPNTLVVVALPSTGINNNFLYNVENLAKSVDRLFLIASDFIVPEVKNTASSNPLYGYNANEYWSSVSKLLGSLQERIPANKLVMERAWYGNGNSYPLYKPKNNSVDEKNRESYPVELNQETIENLAAGVPAKGKDSARKNIPLIAKALSDEGILDSNVLAYALATVEHETDETFEPIAEIQGSLSARRLGYEGGANFFGRGFIQITHLRNYKKIGERIGMGDALVRNPELATNPDVAAKILAAFFKDNNVANLASSGNFIAARIPINPDYNGYSIASLATKYELY